jgi:hypothetical protein
MFTTSEVINGPDTCINPRVSIYLSSRHTDWQTTLECAILSNITGTTPSSKIDVSNWKIPKDIKLAADRFNEPQDIDLLIGSDIFYEILRSSNRIRPGNYPAFQETALGWKISCRTPATTPCDTT